MNNTFITATGYGFISLFGFFAGIGGHGVVEGIVSKPEPYGAQLVSLAYQNGKFIQHIKPINTDAIRMKWAAKIERNGEIICSGGNVSTYLNKPSLMTPNTWTGDDCPVLKNGDVAYASWTYETVDGYNVTISGQLPLENIDEQ